MSSLVRRNISLLLPRLLRVSHSSVSPQVPSLLRLQQVQRVESVRLVGTTNLSRANTSHAVRLQEEDQAAEKSRKLEEKLVRFLGKVDSDVKSLDRVLKHEVENSIKIVETIGSCSSNQALLLLKCHGEVRIKFEGSRHF